MDSDSMYKAGKLIVLLCSESDLKDYRVDIPCSIRLGVRWTSMYHYRLYQY